MDSELSDEDRTGPRYLQVGKILQKRIETGAYAVGSLLPTEIELCEEFDVSRHTIRDALRRLIDGGLVHRRQGSGSQVIARTARESYVHSMRSLSELFQYAADTVLRVDHVEEVVPDAEYGPLLGPDASQAWLLVEGVRLGGQQPICFSVVFINAAYSEIAGQIKQHNAAIYSLMESHFGITVADVEQQITCEPMSKRAARKLGTTTRIWAVRVVRRYIGADGKLLMVSINYHPGDHFSYTMHLRREGGKEWA